MQAWMVLSAICQCPNGYSLDFAWMVLGYRIYAKLNVLPSAAPGSAIPARNIVALFSRDIFNSYNHKISLTCPTYIGQYRPWRTRIELPDAGRAYHQSCSICKEIISQHRDMRHIGRASCLK